LHPNAQPLEEAQRQLSLLLRQQEQLAPGLYRELALYLQVLREGLLHAVQQACFHLATQVVPERYGQLGEERRHTLQRRLVTLVKRCNALLTVEQLMGLAAQQQRRQRRREARRQQQALEAFMAGTQDEPTAAAEPPAAAELPAAPPTAGQPGPAGSVTLGLDLPLSADLFEAGVPGLADLQPELPQRPEPSESRAAAGEELQLLQSLFSMAAEGLGEPAQPRPALAAAGAPTADQAATATQLPRDPLVQLRWWGHFDQALRQRLRTLSHAVNVELLRLGLAQALLPVTLLDAVLQGQVEALPAPANLLRLPLPLPTPGGPGPEVMALLLRPGDLEFDQPKLRHCRKRLEQRRRELKTMAQRYRYWQRRLAALEAEQQWFQDSAQHQSPQANP
jgi:hypothetical protein